MLNSERLGSLCFSKVLLRLASVCFLATLAAHAQTYTVLHEFVGKPTDGAFANGELIQDAAGNFYGTTVGGGANGDGTAFKMDSTGNVTILHSFADDSNGEQPYGGLLLDTQGDLYGTTLYTVFRLDPNGSLKTLHLFGPPHIDGSEPRSRLVTINGDLYGTTASGGTGTSCADGCGIIFKMTKGGTETILYSFTGGADGGRPQGLVRDSAGNLYGVASVDGTGSAGTVFKLDTAGVFTVLYTFNGGADGGTPIGRLIQDAKGNFHGVTEVGGDPKCNCGVVFRLDSSGNEAVVHKFFGGGGGGGPLVGLIDVGGTLYGTTAGGGDFACGGGCGVLYQIGKTGQYTVLHRFGGLAASDGAGNLIGALTLGSDGSIYGATWYGGMNCAEDSQGCGTIFKYTP